MQVTMEVPESAFSALRKSPDEFLREMRLAAAVKWYELRMVSQGKAAELAGVSRAEFLNSMGRYQVSPFQLSAEELAAEAERE